MRRMSRCQTDRKENRGICLESRSNRDPKRKSGASNGGKSVESEEKGI